MDITCSAEPCPIILNATCVFYEGNTLIYTGITTNDNLQTALQKIDQKFQDAGLGYIFSNGIEQLTPGGAVMLGGALIQNTTIGGLYNLAFAGTLEASAFITTGGASTDFVKGDGSLDSTSYQPSGNYISNLTGDVTANGPGSVTATLATVFGSPGTYGNSGSVPSITVDGKGRITNVTPVPINYPAQSLSFVGDVDGFGFTGSPVTLTLDTVNTDVYGSNNFLKFAVNGKGLITSATPVNGGDITTALGYVPVDDSIQLSINGVAQDLTANRSWSVGTVTSVGVTAGLGISASVSNPNTTPVINIVNTAPDQTVILNAGYGISIAGSYPNFTITNDYPDLPNEGVTSFSAGNLSPLFTTSVINPTTTPALNFALSSAAANTVFAGPDGGAGAPTFRSLVAADLPSLSYISSISTTAPLSTTGGLTPTLSISQAGSATDGYLSTTDWNTFNNKEDALGYTPVPDTRQLNINGVNYDLTADRCWSVGTVTSITASAPLTGGTITGSGSVGITQASGGTDGYLSSTDWNTFNGKQPAGNYITDLTGDATASGPGSAGLTLATVNAATGTFGSSTQVPVITVNNKGLVTCVTTSNISGSLEFIGDVTGIGSTGTCTSLTLATVNNDVYTSETLLNIAVNGKGLITSANPTTAGDICSTLGYTPEDVANKSTCTSLGVSNTLYPTQLAVKTYVDSATAGGIILQGDWNANTNTPDISGTTTTGWAWRVSVAGTTNLGGITDWQVGDLAVKSATGWVKIDNSDGVTSVFGRFGAVVATTGDYLSCQVTECGNLYYTDARVRAAVGHTAPLTYNSTTGVFGISQSNTTTDGYLSATDWTTFNDKQPLIAAGTTSQYYRGDKTFQTLDTSVVTEGTNLYFTNTRARAAICASSGVAYNSTTGLITNSCPDQIVALTGGGTTSITGTYPNFTITSADSCLGTVTSVAVSGTNIGVTGSPITSSGTIGLSLSAANVCSALGFSPYNATNPAGYTTCTGTVTCVAASTSTTGVSITGSPITSSGTLGINVSTASSVCTGLLTAADWNTFNSHTGCTGTVTSVGLTSSTTGVSIGSSPITSSGNITLAIATASSLCTGLLTAADWNTFNSHTGCTGTVTSVNATGTNISVTGGPITTSGSLAISLSGANVCSALGYTPYNATNPNGYTTCVGTVTSAGIVATNINVCNSPVTTSGNICLNLTGANVCSALGYSPVQPNGTGATGTWPISITGSAGTSNVTTFVCSPDGGRNPDTAPLPNTNPRSVSYNFATSGSVGGTGNYAGVMTYSPWDGTSASTGDSSYQLAFLNDTGVNASGIPGLSIRNGINSSWNATWYRLLTSGNYNSYSPTLTGGGASGTWSITATGNVASRAQSNWNDNTVINNVIGLMAWKNYGNNHVIFDASQGVSPSGGGVSQTNATVAWSASYPTLMGWNGTSSYGVRVDSARVADSAGSISGYNNPTTAATANTIVYRDSSANITGAYILGTYFNASAGNSENPTIGQIWTQNTTDNYLRKSTPAHFISQLGLVTGGPYLPLSGGTISGNLGLGVAPDLRLSVNGDAHISSILYMGGTAGSLNSWGSRTYTTSGLWYNNSNGVEFNNYGYGSTWSFTINGGNAISSGSMRAPIFYDQDDTSYYVDPNGTSNLLKLSGRTMAYNDMNPMSANSPYAARYNGSAQYRNGTMGYGVVDFNVILSNWGSGFIDTWGSPGNAPGGSTHYVGLQSFHYNFENSSQAYGFQMACAGEADNRFFWRSAWPNVRSWVEMIHSGNIGSQSVSYANSAGSATNSTNTTNISLISLGNGSVNVNNGASAVYRNENGNGGNYPYAPVLHLGGSDTMWQIQGNYAGQTGLQWRSGYAGTWYAWWQILHSANYNSYSPTLTGGGASGTWGINVTGNAATATGQQSSANFTINTGGAGYGLVGVYNPNVHQGFFAMGAAYTLGAGGNLANFYGVSWTYDYPGYGINTGYNLAHCMAVANNGTVYSVIGVGIWTSGLIRANGAISSGSTMTATGFFESSDSRFKQLIQDDYRAVGVQNIKPKLYIKDGKEEVGYFAQDLQSVLSSAVTESNEGLLNLSYTQVHTVKIAYIEDEVDILKKEVKELKSKLQKYEA